MRSASTLALIAAALALSACKPKPPATPEAAYRAFAAQVSAARKGKELELLTAFDAPTRAALTERAKAASKATGDFLPADPTYQLLQGSLSTAPLAEVKAVDRTDDHATLEVIADGGTSLGKVQMVKEAGSWKIHLELK